MPMWGGGVGDQAGCGVGLRGGSEGEGEGGTEGAATAAATRGGSGPSPEAPPRHVWLMPTPLPLLHEGVWRVVCLAACNMHAESPPAPSAGVVDVSVSAVPPPAPPLTVAEVEMRAGGGLRACGSCCMILSDAAAPKGAWVVLFCAGERTDGCHAIA